MQDFFDQRVTMPIQYPNLLAQIIYSVASDEEDQDILTNEPTDDAAFAQFAPEPAHLGVYSFNMSIVGAFRKKYNVIFYTEITAGFNLKQSSAEFQLKPCDENTQLESPYPPDTQEFSVCVNKPREIHERVCLTLRKFSFIFCKEIEFRRLRSCSFFMSLHGLLEFVLIKYFSLDFSFVATSPPSHLIGI